MTNTTDSEREPLLSPIHTRNDSSGSVVSYMIAPQNCTNVTMKDRAQASSTKKKLWFAVCLACCFFATELVAGYFANSLGKYYPTMFKYC
jgi:Co/Zn/Cd efflux system component